MMTNWRECVIVGNLVRFSNKVLTGPPRFLHENIVTANRGYKILNIWRLIDKYRTNFYYKLL